MCHAILEVKYKDEAPRSDNGIVDCPKYIYPKTEKEFNLKLNELRASDNTISIVVFPKTKTYLKKVIWDETT